MRALISPAQIFIRSVAALLGLGCTAFPTVSDSVIEEARLIAVIAEPPEVRPGQEVQYQLVAVDRSGDVSSFRFDASYCISPKPLTESGSVSEVCLFEKGIELSSLDTKASGPVPSGACALFGPEPPPGEFRPRDPDITGGFFAPVRLHAFDETSIFLERILCAPADVDADVARAFAAEYVPNQNPGPVMIQVESESPVESVLTVVVPENSFESFVRIDPETKRLIADWEILTVRWYATNGRLEDEEQTLALESPEGAVRVHLFEESAQSADVWVVVRDSRGGSAAAHARISIE